VLRAGAVRRPEVRAMLAVFHIHRSAQHHQPAVAIHLRLRGQESRVLAGCRFRLVVMEIAIADVAEGDDPNLRESLRERPVGALDELRNARDRQ